MSSASKAEVRRLVREAIARMSPGARAAGSAELCSRVLSMDEFARATTIMLYCPTDDEVNIRPLIEYAWSSGKVVALPRVNWKRRSMHPARVRSWDDVEPTRHGLHEPRPESDSISTDSVDLMVIPGVAFDAQGWRVGRGGGFYDAFLHVLTGSRPMRMGVCWSEQFLPSVPHDAQDERMHMVITPKDAVFVAMT
jgi:5-formyltetrahydrofolate cyclo-ligase